MLEKISYLGHELQNLAFELFEKEPDGNGYYKYSVTNDSNVEVTVNEDNTKFVELSVNSVVTGFLGEDEERDDNEKVFCINLDFIISFEFPSESESVKRFIDENYWYFENYSYLASRDIVSSVLQHNPIVRNTYLPAHRIQRVD